MSSRRDPGLPSRYEPIKAIGNGSYGTVYQAYDQVTRQNVAIKKIKRVFDDLIDCKRILREIAILSRVDDNRIVKLYDICVPQDLVHFAEIYLVLELCDSDFKKLFGLREYLTESHTTLLLYNTLCGIKFLHSAGIYHRDLKPANCLVNTDCSVKICDFGLSRAVGAEEPQQLAGARTSSGPTGPQPLKRQLTGHVVTRWYRAPELILMEDYTEQIDIWSMGCIYAELLGMIKENIISVSSRGPLFQGGSCFPLSPERKREGQSNQRASRDQLNMIFNVIGTPSDEDIESTVEKEDVKAYLKCFQKRPSIPLEEIDRFRHTSDEGLDLLSKMIVFDAGQRIDVEEALAHPLFDPIRRRDQEALAKERIVLDFEAESELDEGLLRKYFIKEIQRYHPEVKMPEVMQGW